jgi:hypothetical protein
MIMKNKILIFFFLLFFSGCSIREKANKYKSKTDCSNVIYLLSTEAEYSIYSYISKYNEYECFFLFEFLDDNKIKIHLRDKKDYKDFLPSNRKLYINNKYYDIMFKTDFSLYIGTKNDVPQVWYGDNPKKKLDQYIDIPNVSVRNSKPENFGYERKLNIIDLSIYWIVNSQGDLIESNTTN